MGASLKFTDLRRLGDALEVCARPGEFDSVDEWRGTLLRRVMEMLEAPMGHCDLLGLGLPRSFLSVGYSPGIFEGWARDWRQSDPGFELTQTSKLNVYTRRHRHRLAGAEWTRRYRRSAVYQEFYKRNNLVDGAGILVLDQNAQTVAHLHADADGPRGDLMDERGRALLTALQPAFNASVSAIRSVGVDAYLNQALLLNATEIPAALLDAKGHWLHQTPAFTAAIGALTKQQQRQALAGLSQHATRLVKNHGTVDQSSISSLKTELRILDYTVNAIVVYANALSGNAQVLVRLRRHRRKSDLVSGFASGLTKRESEVASLLAVGRNTKQIAAQLEISWHTVRRHTESILKKLQLESRSAISAALSRIDAGGIGEESSADVTR